MPVWSQSAEFNQKQMHYFQMFFTLGCRVLMATTVEDNFLCLPEGLIDLFSLSVFPQMNKSIKW